jgi:hypothetical protein
LGTATVKWEDCPDQPLELLAAVWPQFDLYDKQVDIVESVWANQETFVPAAHQMGKDLVAAFIALAFFLTHSPSLRERPYRYFQFHREDFLVH